MVKGSLKDAVYKSLKYAGCISQALWYDQILKIAKSSFKCCKGLHGLCQCGTVTGT